ncbi:dehydroquinase class II [Cladophialophora yegresii CBS 114405]|uniref:Catabolic 3-dehydroquinase n=1 Tax=Cladophialophora yegresii CBS 114405 TaxID=1182544 RepID=W9X0B1_9EURO|nr:dehydroquinase class II [Cladophialophora yegresii CBS 114405]EXJ63924.1 dehydroquinase class II [Cladophialophora yegresii CBS 114405]
MSTPTPPSVSPSRKILLINGPNLNLLGTREPTIYGSATLPDVVASTISLGKTHNIEVHDFQSNHEGEIVDFLHSHFVRPRVSAGAGASAGESPKAHDRTAVIINPAAFTHTSVAIRDALLATGFPFVEVHVSNVHAREEFRRHSYFSDKAVGVVAGLGVYGYRAALEFWGAKWDEEDGKDRGRR